MNNIQLEQVVFRCVIDAEAWNQKLHLQEMGSFEEREREETTRVSELVGEAPMRAQTHA